MSWIYLSFYNQNNVNEQLSLEGSVCVYIYLAHVLLILSIILSLSLSLSPSATSVAVVVHINLIFADVCFVHRFIFRFYCLVLVRTRACQIDKHSCYYSMLKMVKFE